VNRLGAFLNKWLRPAGLLEHQAMSSWKWLPCHLFRIVHPRIINDSHEKEVSSIVTLTVITHLCGCNWRAWHLLTKFWLTLRSESGEYVGPKIIAKSRETNKSLLKQWLKHDERK
jgi:hypothetical protein